MATITREWGSPLSEDNPVDVAQLLATGVIGGDMTLIFTKERNRPEPVQYMVVTLDKTEFAKAVKAWADNFIDVEK